MTQISGKIYQMKNAAGTENRFPRTVMEAVLGLNTYLQQQFSALADIYMPIEGISEALTDQEFVYRISPNTIKAKSLTLDRILGRTLAWNQAAPLYSVQSMSFGWAFENCNFTVSNDGRQVDISFTSANNMRYRLYAPTVSGHKYYCGYMVKASAGALTPSWATNEGILPSLYGNGVLTADTWTHIGSIYSCGVSGNMSVVYPSTGISLEGETLSVKDFVIIDLTLLGLDDITVAAFEALYPGYHDYSAGKLISNDASEIETVGRNVWDEEWENGTYDIDGKKDNDGGSWVRCKNLIPVLPNTNYYAKSPENMFVQFYDASGNFIYGVSGYDAYNRVTVKNSSFTTPSSARYISMFLTSAYGATYNHDICINLSDESFNSQYEPYRKSTLRLDLYNIRVKSHNIWDEEWELGVYNGDTGLKEANSAYIRSKNLISIISQKEYYIKAPSSGVGYIRFFNANNEYMGRSASLYLERSGVFSVPDGAAYMVFQWQGTTYNNDICINVSSSFNGQYEPHGILTMTGGVRSADDNNYNEIVGGNKYIMRVKEVDWGTLDWVWYADGRFNALISDAKDYGNNVAAILLTATRYTAMPSKTALSDGQMSFSYNSDKKLYVVDSGYSGKTAAQWKADKTGVKMNYVLATPIEYELAEPLVPTVKAGTTEARISPNADGLSAPFRADMTYSASENNDAATSQYAATAGRLLNAQTIWGQTFDGSSPVSGALTGVTTLNASGAITAGSFVKSGGTASQFLKADGSVDSTAYLPLAGGTMTGNLVMDVASNAIFDMKSDGDYDGRIFVSNLGRMSMELYKKPSGYNAQISLLGGYSYPVFRYNGTDYTIYHSGNSNLNTVDWAVKNLTLAGTITGATSIDSLIYFDTTNSRIGIGTASPAHKLDVSGTFRATGNSLIGGTLGVTGAATLSSTLAVTGNTTIGGNLTVGTSASNKILSVYGDSNLMGKVYVGKDEASAPGFVLDADSQAGLKIKPDTAATNHYMHLSTAGVLTVTDGIVCNGNISLTGDHFIDFNSGTGLPLSRLYFNADDNETFFESPLPFHFECGVVSDSYITAGASASSSDARLKDNISAISTDKALSILSSLKGVEWDWNEKSGLYGQHGSGLVAQEVQKVMPWAVLELNDKLSLNYNSLWGIAIPVIQDLVDRIHQLEEKVKELSKS